MPTTFHKVTNNAFGTLQSAINSSATTLTLNSGQGATFPVSGPFFITVVDEFDSLHQPIGYEIIEVASRNVDVLTVQARGSQNTTAISHNASAQVFVYQTAQNITELQSAVNTLENGVSVSIPSTFSEEITFSEGLKVSSLKYAKFGTNGELRASWNSNLPRFELTDASNVVLFSMSTAGTISAKGFVTSGISDTLNGCFDAYGDSNTTGGTVRVWNGANADTVVENWAFQTINGNLLIKSNGGTGGTRDVLSVDASTLKVTIANDLAANNFTLAGNGVIAGTLTVGGALVLRNGYASTDNLLDWSRTNRVDGAYARWNAQMGKHEYGNPTISATVLTMADIEDVASYSNLSAAHIEIYSGTEWNNKPLSGDIEMDSNGVVTVLNYTHTHTEFGELDTRLDTLETASTDYASRLTTIEGNEVTTDGRLDTLEAWQTTANADIASLEAADTALDGRVTTLESTATSLDGRVDTLELNYTSTDNRLDTLEGTSGTHGTRLTSLENADTALDARLDVLEAKSTAIELTASGITPTTTNGCDTPAIDVNDNWSASFSATGKNGFFQFAIPENFNGVKKLTFYSSGNGAAEWEISTVIFADGTALNTAYTAFATTVSVTHVADQMEVFADASNFANLLGSANANAGKLCKVKINLKSGTASSFHLLKLEY